jgi:hypothetical protein
VVLQKWISPEKQNSCNALALAISSRFFISMIHCCRSDGGACKAYQYPHKKPGFSGTIK